jgi:rubrerythrin/uncharacterized damage-inducible protein DinB
VALDTERLRAASADESAASARSLAAAERAVDEGRLNLAKVLRANALGARQRALMLSRLADEGIDALTAIELGRTASRTTSDALAGASGLVADTIIRSAKSAERVLRITADALASRRDVSESEIAQILWACEVCGIIVESGRPEICPSCGCISGEFALFAPFFSGTAEHLGRKQPAEILSQLRDDGGRLADQLRDRDDDALRWRPAEGEWCAKEIAGHMLDIVDLTLRRIKAAITNEAPPAERTMLPWKLLDTENYPDMAANAISDRFEQSLAELSVILEGLDTKGWRARIDMVSGKTLAIDVGSWVANHNTAHMEQLRARLEAAP